MYKKVSSLAEYGVGSRNAPTLRCDSVGHLTSVFSFFLKVTHNENLFRYHSH